MDDSPKSKEVDEPMTDGQIVALFLERSEGAIQAVDAQYGRLCHSLARNILHSRESAEECVNDAYLALWQTIPPAQPEPLLPYVCRVVRNQALKAYERIHAAKRGAGCQVALEEIAECLAAPQSVEETVEARETVQRLQAFLGSLSPENRVIFLRRYWFFDSYRDIARQVGMTEKNVSVRLTRLRRQLKDEWKESEGKP